MKPETQTAEVPKDVAELVTRLRSRDDSVRGPAFQNAGPLGAPAVRSLARAITDSDPEAARAAKRALWNVVHHAGRPGAESDTEAVERALIALPVAEPNPVRREIVWMLSEIGGPESARFLGGLLGDPILREDARCALQRIPGREAVEALRRGLASADAEFAAALAEALRARGETIENPRSRKLQPTRTTTVGA